MKANDRRKKIIEYLGSQNEPVPGASLASIFNVTRQIIVQDMAILRAENNKIIATSQGYTILPVQRLYSKKIVCSHNISEVREELITIVESGCKILDVVVEHPVYGEIKGNLMLSSVKDIDEFMEKISDSNASLLSQLTNGIHIHTIESLNEDTIKRTEKLLRDKGILVE